MGTLEIFMICTLLWISIAALQVAVAMIIKAIKK